MRTICEEAHEILNERQGSYGDIAITMELAGELVAKLSNTTDTPGQRVALTQLVLKLVRRLRSPENPDHLRDACGYAGIMQVLEEIKAPKGPAPYFVTRPGFLPCDGDHGMPACRDPGCWHRGECDSCNAEHQELHLSGRPETFGTWLCPRCKAHERRQAEDRGGGDAA